MQNFNPNHEDQHLNSFNNQFTNSGQGNLPGQTPSISNQPTIIRPENPVQKVEQAQTFEKPRPASPQQRSLRPQQNPIRTTQNPVRKTVAAAVTTTLSKEEQINEIFVEIESLKKQSKRPGALTRIEKLLRQVLDLNT